MLSHKRVLWFFPSSNQLALRQLVAAMDVSTYHLITATYLKLSVWIYAQFPC